MLKCRKIYFFVFCLSLSLIISKIRMNLKGGLSCQTLSFSSVAERCRWPQDQSVSRSHFEHPSKTLISRSPENSIFSPLLPFPRLEGKTRWQKRFHQAWRRINEVRLPIVTSRRDHPKSRVRRHTIFLKFLRSPFNTAAQI